MYCVEFVSDKEKPTQDYFETIDEANKCYVLSVYEGQRLETKEGHVTLSDEYGTYNRHYFNGHVESREPKNANEHADWMFGCGRFYDGE